MMFVFKRVLLALLLLCCAGISQSSDDEHYLKEISSDFVSLDLIPGKDSNKIFAGGYRGVLGKITLSDEGALFTKTPAPLDMDILVIRALSNDEALIGTSKGDIYRLSGGSLKHVALLSEFNEPVLDMAVNGDDVWAVGPRGLVAHSTDKGITWNVIEIEQVHKDITLTSTAATTWYLGVSNIDIDSLVFNATVNGKKVIDDEDYYFNANEGSLEIVNPLDESSDLAISFKYLPGPQFQAGDVTLNTVSIYGDKVLMAGEFGTVLSFDKINGWVSLYTELRQEESSMPYWMESNVSGRNIVLVGAGGVVSRSSDSGQSWVSQNLGNDNGIFGAVLTEDSSLIVAGAVGTIARLSNEKWMVADRSSLRLIAWLKSIVSLGNDSYLVSGGRGSMVLYKNKTWHKILLRGIK